MRDYRLLKDVLCETKQGLQLTGRHLIPKTPRAKSPIPYLKHYMMDDELARIRDHNLDVVHGKKNDKLKFAFAWIMLPTACNQRCAGCFEGNDKPEQRRFSPKQMLSLDRLDAILAFLKERGGKMVAYGGIGELFTMTTPAFPLSAFDYIDHVVKSGFKMLIFTNGTLLTAKAMSWLAARPISIIISLRDTRETEHNRLVGIAGFQRSMRAIEWGMRFGLHKQNRLAVELPVIHGNETRILLDFIPAMRHVGVIPFVEQYIQLRTSLAESKLGLTFGEARQFFRMAQEVERLFGYEHEPVWGQRMLSQPKCERFAFSFAVYPDGTVTSCPSQQHVWGNINGLPPKEVLDKMFDNRPNMPQYCACSVFHTSNDNEIPTDLPNFLRRCQ